jgi:hypothetical protein
MVSKAESFDHRQLSLIQSACTSETLDVAERAGRKISLSAVQPIVGSVPSH